MPSSILIIDKVFLSIQGKFAGEIGEAVKLTTSKGIYIYLLLSFYLQRHKVGSSKKFVQLFGRS